MYRLLASVSIANLFLMRIWHKLLYSKGYFSNMPIRYELAILSLNMIALTCFSLVLIYAAERENRALRYFSRFFIMTTLLIPLNFLRSIYGWDANYIIQHVTLPLGVIIVCLLITAFIYVFSRWNNKLYKAVFVLFVMLAPFAFLNMARAANIWANYTVSGSVQDVSTHSVSSAANRNRVIWLIFDETDQRLAFAERPAGLQLPNFDKFAQGALVAENAYPPAGETLRSLPALLTGELISDAWPASANDLLVRLGNEKNLRTFSSMVNVFSTARANGYRSGLIGFYHPYPRMISKDMDYCTWLPYEYYHGDEYRGVMENAIKQLGYALIISEGIQMNRWGEIQHHIKLYERTLESCKIALLDHKLNLIVVHLPVPHLPAIYDRSTNTFREQSNMKGDYFDNLVLADRTFGTIQGWLQADGRWDASTIIVSTDHWWRGSKSYDGKGDHRIPFMLKLPGQSKHVVISKPFNTVVTSSLVMQILEDNLSKPEDVEGWIATNSKIGPSPYYNKL
jgi:hypothetical protein